MHCLHHVVKFLLVNERLMIPLFVFLRMVQISRSYNCCPEPGDEEHGTLVNWMVEGNCPVKGELSTVNHQVAATLFSDYRIASQHSPQRIGPGSSGIDNHACRYFNYFLAAAIRTLHRHPAYFMTQVPQQTCHPGIIERCPAQLFSLFNQTQH